MGNVHTKHTVLIVGGYDLSTYTNTSEFERSGDKHDTTTYGNDDHVFSPGLGTGSFKFGGIYDDGAAGPRAILKSLVNTVTTIVRRPEGTGSGLPQDSFSALIEKYTESSPVADMIAWSCDCTVSGSVDDTAQ